MHCAYQECYTARCSSLQPCGIRLLPAAPGCYKASKEKPCDAPSATSNGMPCSPRQETAFRSFPHLPTSSFRDPSTALLLQGCALWDVAYPEAGIQTSSGSPKPITKEGPDQNTVGAYRVPYSSDSFWSLSICVLAGSRQHLLELRNIGHQSGENWSDLQVRGPRENSEFAPDMKRSR